MLYYNTTTIPSSMVQGTSFFENFMFMIGTLTSSTLFTLIFFEYYFFKTREVEEDEDDTSEEETSDDEEEDSELTSKFKALTTRELSETEFADLETKIVKVDTEGGEVIMTYHKPTEAFWYYTDHLKDVSYRILETVAQQFVIEHDCKSIYVLPASEDIEAVEAAAEEAVKAAEEAVVETKTVFAKFKSYNKGSNPSNYRVANDTSGQNEESNHFRYKGKTSEYFETLEKTKQPVSTLSFKEYLSTIKTSC